MYSKFIRGTHTSLVCTQLAGMTIMVALALCAVVYLQTSQERRVQLAQMGVGAEDENDGKRS